MPTATVSRSAKTTAIGAAPKPSKAPRLNGGQRRRPAVWGAGVALVAAGAAIATSAALSAGAKHDVLALRKPVPAGRLLTAADLRTVRVAADSTVATVPAAQEAIVVGQRTAVDLVANSLLAPDALGGSTVPGVGKALLGVALKAGQLPARGLSRGDLAELIPTPPTTSGAASTGSAVRAATPVPVTVDAESAAGSDGVTIVDLVLPADAAPAVAAQAAAGQLVLVLLPRTGS
jgi:hypothetical protein